MLLILGLSIAAWLAIILLTIIIVFIARHYL